MLVCTLRLLSLVSLGTLSISWNLNLVVLVLMLRLSTLKRVFLVIILNLSLPIFYEMLMSRTLHFYLPIYSFCSLSSMSTCSIILLFACFLILQIMITVIIIFVYVSEPWMSCFKSSSFYLFLYLYLGCNLSAYIQMGLYFNTTWSTIYLFKLWGEVGCVGFSTGMKVLSLTMFCHSNLESAMSIFSYTDLFLICLSWVNRVLGFYASADWSIGRISFILCCLFYLGYTKLSLKSTSYF